MKNLTRQPTSKRGRRDIRMGPRAEALHEMNVAAVFGREEGHRRKEKKDENE